MIKNLHKSKKLNENFIVKGILFFNIASILLIIILSLLFKV